METILKLIEKLTGKHFHYYSHPSKLVYPDVAVYYCRCKKVAKQVLK